MKQFFNLEDVQKMLDVSERTILRYLDEGELTGFKVGREWRFEQKDIDAFIDQRRKKTGEERQQKDGVPDAA